MRTIERSTQFKKDYKKYSKSVYGSELDVRLKEVIGHLLADQPLPIKFRDHQLRGTEVVRLVRLGLALVAIRWWCWMVAQITALAHWLRHQPTPRSALGSQGVGAIRGLVATAIQHGFNHRRCNAEIAGMQFSEHLPATLRPRS